jgi:hypothetical protein
LYTKRSSFDLYIQTYQDLAGSSDDNFRVADHPPGISPKALDWNAAELPKVNPIVFLDRVAPQPSAECLDNDSYGNPENSSV